MMKSVANIQITSKKGTKTKCLTIFQITGNKFRLIDDNSKEIAAESNCRAGIDILLNDLRGKGLLINVTEA